MNKPLILVVDDDHKSRKLASDILQSEGYATLEASNGGEAIEAARTHNPQVIILDIRLPDCDGKEVAATIRRDPDLVTTGIIAVTASAFPEDKGQILASGIDAYLPKPIRVQEFLRIVAANMPAVETEP